MKTNFKTPVCAANPNADRVVGMLAGAALLLLLGIQARATTFTVLNTSDAGPGSLRQAILDANASPGLDEIEFAIAPGGAQTIQPLSTLPAVTDPTIIDGTTQPGFSGAPLIAIDGTVAGGTALRITAGSSSILALSLNQFPGSGISLEVGDGNLVATINASWSGLTPTGYGVHLASSSGNTVEHLTASGRHVGIFVGGAANTFQNNVLAGNYYGIDTYGNTGQANRYLDNDLSGCTYALRIHQDLLFEVAGNNFDGSASGLELLDMAGIDFAPAPGTVDPRRTTGTALRLGNVINSRVAGLDLSWIGGGQSGTGLWADGCASLTVENITAHERITGVALSNSPGSMLSGINASASGPGFVGYGPGPLRQFGHHRRAPHRQRAACGLGSQRHGTRKPSALQFAPSEQLRDYGISDQTSGTGNEAHENHIAENALAGVQNLNAGSLFNAENNFWTTTDGPAPIGSGNSITGNIDADPFLTSAPPCLSDADRDPPVVTCPPAISAPLDAVPPAATSAAAFIAQGGTITDNRDPSPSVSSSDSISGHCPMLITRTYTVTDADGNAATCDQLITVENLFAEDGIIWHQPLARNGASEDTDPSAGGTLKYRFKLGSTIPIRIHAQGCGGADVTGNANVIGTVEVFGDTNCEGVVDGNTLPIDYNGVGEAGGVMDKIDGHLKYNLDTKKLPQTTECYILQVTVTDSSTGESRSEIVPLQAR